MNLLPRSKKELTQNTSAPFSIVQKSAVATTAGSGSATAIAATATTGIAAATTSATTATWNTMAATTNPSSIALTATTRDTIHTWFSPMTRIATTTG
ncbi:MAG: hypothetical protein RR053_06235 [Evtepia sp.]